MGGREVEVSSLRGFHSILLTVQYRPENPNSLSSQMGSEPIGPHRAVIMEGTLFRTVRIPKSGELIKLRVGGGNLWIAF